MSTTKTTERTAEKALPSSPLLNAQPPHAKSTINLNKLEKFKFPKSSSVETNDTSSLRIIIYVIIVIVIGVGAALLARQLMNSNNSVVEGDKSTETEDTSSRPISYTNGYSIDTTVRKDSDATYPPKNTDFKSSSLVTLGGATVDITNASLNNINYMMYQTFGRIVFNLITTENKLPKTNFVYDAVSDSLAVEIVGLTNINSDLKVNKEINDIVNSITFDSATNKFTLLFKQTSLYKVFAVDDSLYIDVRTQDVVEEQNTTESTSTDAESTNTGSSSSTTDTSRPAAPHFTNTFSQSTQYVSSTVNTKSIALNNYYTWDQGQFFEFSWAEEGKEGDIYVPNTKAYLKEESGKNYIYVEIDNLTRATLPGGTTAAEVQTKTGVNMANANFVAITMVEFTEATGKAIYKIELNKKADFQLLTQTTLDEDTQILSIQIKD